MIGISSSAFFLFFWLSSQFKGKICLAHDANILGLMLRISPLIQCSVIQLSLYKLVNFFFTDEDVFDPFLNIILYCFDILFFLPSILFLLIILAFSLSILFFTHFNLNFQIWICFLFPHVLIILIIWSNLILIHRIPYPMVVHLCVISICRYCYHALSACFILLYLWQL